jgi:predicted transcriptional regulator
LHGEGGAAQVNRERGPGPGPPTEKVGAAKSRIKGPEEYHEENSEKQLNVHRQRNALIRAIHERINEKLQKTLPDQKMAATAPNIRMWLF